jgi:hypothetical protein
MNRFAWDLRYEPPLKIPKAIYDNGRPAGPLGLPGAYQVRLTVAGKSYTAPLEVKMDPRVTTSADDLRKQFDLLLKLRDRQDEMNKAVLAIRDLRAQLQSVERHLNSHADAKAVVSTAADLRKKTAAIEEELIQVNATAQEDEANYPTKLNSKLGYLNGVTDSADTAPTEAELAVFSKLDEEMEAQLTKWHDIVAKDIPALNESMRRASVPLIVPTPLPTVTAAR